MMARIMARINEVLRAIRRAGWTAITLTGLIAFALATFALLRARPQDLPWTPLDLANPIGAFTGRKITALTGDFPRCRALLDRAGVRYTTLPEKRDGQCGYVDGVHFEPGGARAIEYLPRDLGVSCPVAAALSVWEWEVVQPAAEQMFGQRVASIDHYGSYNCRRFYGRATGGWSEHATADAIDVAGFTLSDGRHIGVLKDWHSTGDNGVFLRRVRNGACKLFATTLSPDYNIEHRDHLHLDQAARGNGGWRACS